MRYLGDATTPPASKLPPNVTRDQLATALKALPPASTVVNPGDAAFLIANADLVPLDYAEPLFALADATTIGEHARHLRYGIGFAVGAAVAGIAAYLVWGR